jgi:glycosyltransferase involved in cell wall biosynthesis
MKIAVLWNTLTGYLNACLAELAKEPGVRIFVSDRSGKKQAPFDDALFNWIEDRYRFPEHPDARDLLPRLAAFGPDILLVASWNSPAYRDACKMFRGRAVRVCAMDNQWYGTAKQWLGVLTAPMFLRPLFDAAFVAGERQATFAGKLGFSVDRIWRGNLAPDVTAFESASKAFGQVSRKGFLYAGRLSQEKGIDTLIEAYRLYRSTVVEPWSLRVAGEGTESELLVSEPGVELLGFVQPSELPKIFAQAKCCVVPSRWEPWGVVLQEACASGLPIICTTVCGSSVHFLQDGYNGYAIEKGNSNALAFAMKSITEITPHAYSGMVQASYSLSQQFTPERWASYLLCKGREILQSFPNTK